MESVAVEARAKLRLATPHAKTRFVEVTGVFACSAAAIRPYVERLPSRVKVLDRAPTDAEVETARELGLLPRPGRPQDPPATPPGTPGGGEPPARSFEKVLRDDLVAVAEQLGLDTSGTRAEVYSRVAAYAQLAGLSLDGSVEEVTARLLNPAPPAGDDQGQQDPGQAGGDQGQA